MSTSNIFYSNQLDTVSINEKQLPILYDVDAVIVGGSFAGISLAKNLAENGKTVAIVESRTYLGREVSATLRPWVINQANRNDVPEIMREIINRGEQKNDEIALYIDQVKTHLEDVVLDKGVSLLYASYPTGLYTEESGDKLLVIGNKSGRQIVRAKVIIDTTETASVLHLAGENFESNVTSNRSYWKTIEFYRTDGLTDHSLDVPEYIGVDGHTVHLHQGYLENGHVFLEFKVTMDNIVKGTTLDRVMSDEIASRHTMMKLSEYLIQNHPAFKNAYLAASSFELQPTNFKRLIGSVDHSFDQIVEVADDNKFSLLDFASTDPRLWCVNESARDSRIAELLINPLIASSLGEKLAEQLNQVWDKIVQTAVTANESKRKMETIEGNNSFTVREQDVPEQGRSYQKEIVPDQDIPVLYQTDVLVVGGGTSGATAAITSAKEGMDTVLLEMNPGLGLVGLNMLGFY